MDIAAIRLANAESLKKKCNSMADFARKLGKEPAQVRHWFNPNVNKNIGNKIAREIEAAFNKPHGWMDSIHEQAKGNMTQSNIAAMPSNVDSPSSIPDIASLMSNATPRTTKALEEINQAALSGKLSESDVELLNELARKLSND